MKALAVQRIRWIDVDPIYDRTIRSLAVKTGKVPVNRSAGASVAYGAAAGSALALNENSGRRELLTMN